MALRDSTPYLVAFIPKIDKKTNAPVLFFPETPAKLSRISSYKETGHDEVGMDYYTHGTIAYHRGHDDNLSKRMSGLIAEYKKDMLGNGEILMPCRRDMAKFRVKRWAT